MKGIDVSAHQGMINWENVLKAGIEFAIIRISYGQNNVDIRAIRNIEECIKFGIPFGVYTYSYALNVSQAINEANLVIKTLAPYKDKISFPVIIDMEDADGYKSKHGMPTNAILVDICEKECTMFEEAGYYPAIYASKSWFDTKLKSKKLDRFDKWMAWWYSKASEKFDHKKYGLWQYSSTGSIAGIPGNVDLNESFKDYPSLILKKDEEEEKMLKELSEKYGEENVRKALVKLIESVNDDGKPADWAKDELKVAVDMGITDGLNPELMCTRQEAAIMVKRAVSK